jgi:hypothetical protein
MESLFASDGRLNVSLAEAMPAVTLIVSAAQYSQIVRFSRAAHGVRVDVIELEAAP